MGNKFLEPPTIKVNPGTCSKCGLCTKICPTKVFSATNGDDKVIKHTEECVLCGQCICGCPTNSIIPSGFNSENFNRIKNKRPVTPESAFEFLSQRRSVRNYKEATPPTELLKKIVEIAGFAPGSPHHRVGWVREITIVTGKDNMNIIRDFTADYIQKTINLLNSWYLKAMANFSELAKAGLGVVPDLQMRLDNHKKGSDLIIYNAPAAIFFHAPKFSSTPQTDCDTALQLVQLYAESFGLATCWNGLIQGAAAGDHLKGFTKLAKFLHIPGENNCYAAMTIGYPSVSLHSIPERKVDVTWINGNK
jgi:NAD-dependent dihydropyrimidine dehydrogenase PreA subunit/nitroreductase